MTSYFEVPVELEAEQLIEGIFTDMAAKFPGWEPAEGNPETWLIRSIVTRLIVPLAELAADVPAEIFYRFGQDVLNVQPVEAQPATVTSTWTVADSIGYAIPAGTEVDILISGTERVGFRVVNEVVIPAGSTQTAAGEVLLEAVEAGAEGSGLSGTIELVDALHYVTDVALVGTTTGGQDAEDPFVYLGRLAATARTMGPHPIIPSDVEVLARNITDVARAVALDMFDQSDGDDPDDPGTWDTERTVTVAVHDVDGQPCTTEVKDAVAADLDAKREANFVFYVVDADYTTIDVDFNVTVYPGFDQASVEADVIAAAEDFLDPAKWGVPAPGEEVQWLNKRTIRYQDLVTVVNNVEGVDYYDLLEMGEQGGGPLGTSDIEMSGAAPLPEPGLVQVAES